MGAFVLRRLLFGVFTIWCISVITFCIFFLLPTGDPALRIAGKNPTPEQLKEIRKEWGFDKSKVTQYVMLMDKLIHGRLDSASQQINVIPLVLKALPVTLSLAFFAAIIWLTVGISVGIKGALSPGSFADRALMIASLVGVSIPAAWLSIYSLKVWTDSVRLFPAGGYLPVAEGGIFGWAGHVLLPGATLAVVFSGVYARMTRSNVRQALQDEHVKTAIAKGLPWRHVFIHHVLRTAMIPVIVLFGLDLAALLGGAIFTETIFGLPGLGSVLLYAIGTFDFPTLIVCAIVAASFVVIANILVDIIQAIVDPRIRLA